MKSKKSSSFGYLFWIALVLLVAVVFLLNRNSMNQVMATTGVLSDSGGSLPVVIDDNSGQQVAEVPVSDASNNTGNLTVQPPEETALVDGEQILATDNQAAPETAAINQQESQKTQNTNIYYVAIDDTGQSHLVGVPRPVNFSNAPLTEAIGLLFTGQADNQPENGLKNLIPPNAKLHSVYVQDKTAFMNFSEEFGFNSYGRVGLNAQLKQIVYTATEFPTVSRVQILIEGQKKQFLGLDGQKIDKPLDRDSF